MRRFVTVALACALMSACGGKGTSTNTNAVALAGNWQLVLTKMVLGNPSTVRNQSGFFVQQANNLGGGLLISGNCAGLGQAQGRVNGSNVSITINQTAQVITLTGSAAADGSSMSGSYSLLASGCGTSEVGTWSANRVKSLNGNLQGTFTSTKNNSVFDYTGPAAQGPNTGTSTASLSGTITSTNAPCFASASLSGLVSGTSVVFNVLAADGTALGKISGTAATDMSTITGSYVFSNPQSNLLAQCGGGDSGSVSFVVQ